MKAQVLPPEPSVGSADGRHSLLDSAQGGQLFVARAAGGTWKDRVVGSSAAVRAVSFSPFTTGAIEASSTAGRVAGKRHVGASSDAPGGGTNAASLGDSITAIACGNGGHGGGRA